METRLYDQIMIDVHLSKGANVGERIGKIAGMDDSDLDVALADLRKQVEAAIAPLEAVKRIKRLDPQAIVKVSHWSD